MVCKNNNNFIECNDISKFSEYENKLFDIFKNLYLETELSYMELKVKMKHYPPDYGIKSSFYHLIYENYSDSNKNEDRLPSLDRCKRLPWIKEIIDKCSTEPCDKILIWENQRHGTKNILLYCSELEYLVVLSKRSTYYLLTTAYPVDKPHRKESLLKEYYQYINKNK